MDNVITITLKEQHIEGPGNIYRIEFESNPTVSELCAAKLVLEEILEHNFKKEEILRYTDLVYPRLENIEEIRRNEVNE